MSSFLQELSPRPLRTVIVEDEQLSRERLRRLLAAYEHQVTIVAKASDGPSAVVLLDISLPELNGFDILRSLHTPPNVIFDPSHPRDVFA